MMVKAGVLGVAARVLRVARLGSLAALVFAGPAAAIGPEAPVDFVATDKGFVVLVIEPAAVTDVQVLRVIHRDGEPLAREAIEWRRLRMLDYREPITRPDDFQYREPDEKRQRPPSAQAHAAPSIESAAPRTDVQLAKPGAAFGIADGPPKRIGVLIPLEAESMRKLADGAYAQKFMVQARLAGQGGKAKPVVMTRWSHFVIKEGRATFISAEEYSRLVDPPSDGVDGGGAKVQLSIGRSVAEKEPLSRTRLNRAIPLGRLGGLVPERDDSTAKRAQKSTAEANER